MKLTSKNLRIFRRAQRKYNVSVEFLKANIANIKKFLLYAVSPHIVIKHQAVRKRCFGRYKVIIDYYHLRRFLFDPARRKMIKRRKKNLLQWSKNIVYYLKKTKCSQEYVEDDEELEQREAEVIVNMSPEDVSKQLKAQLEILRSGKRIATLIEGISATVDLNRDIADEQIDNDKTVEQTENEAIKTFTYENALNDIADVISSKKSIIEPAQNSNVNSDSLGQNPLLAKQNTENIENANLVNESQNQTIPWSKEITESADNNCNPILTNSEKTEILQNCLDKANEKQILCGEQANGSIFRSAVIKDNDDKTKSSNFLDMLMSKVNVRRSSMEDKNKAASENEVTPQKEHHPDAEFTDSSDEFFGFEETELLPGMLLTPLVPYPSRNHSNSAFVSESLNEYMRENLLESIDSRVGRVQGPRRKHRQANCDGLVTPNCYPPKLDMPAVPESLQRLRTVAERRQFLQKSAKHHKLSIINNEVTIYRELQRKIRQQKVKSSALQLLQASNSQMPFTRQGWKATSFIVTDYNKYFYQMLQIAGNTTENVYLPGSRGNNDEKFRNPYDSRVSKEYKPHCTDSCFDLFAWRDFKSIKTQANKAKLNKNPLRPVFKPCPLSQKPFQKPLDDETAALLLAGGSMAVVRMPTVEIQVFPEVGKPLHEVAKRYLQYILPHHDISREWAEFSVSTLQQPQTGLMKEAEKVAAAANAAAGDGRRKSFTFVIPYLNDRNHILVRRVVDRSEQLDRSFEDCDSSNANLSFRADLDPLDTELQECADIVSDMINSVAISCSENSFIKEDPHGVDAQNSKAFGESLNEKEKESKVQQKQENTSASNSAKAVAGVQSQPNRKQHRLLCELRRLNATIIDAGAKHEKDSKPCSNDYCALGCICTSLADEYPMRQHCGKSKCVIECNCKIPQSTRIMRLETDGRSITTEDAFLLRRKATARLARMEKEFTSTIVLTDNETLLINESQYDKKRRCTKAPKRYDDFTDDDDYNKTSPKKTSALMAIESPSLFNGNVDEHSLSNTGYLDLPTELREPIFVKDTILNELKHCSVPLVPLDIKNMAVWCMVHELYKCFCGGRALEGKPIVIEKEDENLPIANANIGETEIVASSSKARYSFEKVENTELKVPNTFEGLNENSEGLYMNEDIVAIQTSEKDDMTVLVHDSEHSDNADSASPKKIERRGRPLKSMKLERRGRPMEQTILRDYMNAKLNWCRRAVAVPKKTYTRRNRKRLALVHEYIEANENAKSRLILNEHIMRSVYYHKNELEKARQEVERTEKLLDKTKVIENGQREQVQKSQYQSKDEEDADDVQFINDSSTDASLNITTKTDKRYNRSKRHRNEINKSQVESQAESFTIADDSNESEDMIANKKLKLSNETDINKSNKVVASKSSEISDRNLQIPIISSCFSLNNQNALDIGSSIENSPQAISLISSAADVCAATQGAEHQTAADLGITDDAVTNANFKEFYNAVIKNMNSLVSKKMQDIDMALKRESKVIPPPNEEILCIIKWSNFLDAFIEGYVFIWEVRMEHQYFFAATISNLMPMILGAVSVINIGAMDVNKLPLIGRMLVERVHNENTSRLAIVMQGRSKYWLVKGFLHPDSTIACAKPTPLSHPSLTKKINLLCSLLVKQRIKEYQRKLDMQNRHIQKTEPVQLHNRPIVARRIVSPMSYQTPSSDSSSQIVKMINQLPATSLSSTNSSSLTASSGTGEPSKESSKLMSCQKQQGKQKRAKKQRQKLHTQTAQSCAATSSSVTMQKNLPTTNVSTTTTTTTSTLNSSILRSLNPSDEINNMKSNIEFRRITNEDIAEIHQPEFLQEDHRWLVLQLYNDFSHIFVPDFRDLVSLDRIHKVMAFSRQKNKIVKLQFFQNAPYDAFVTPSSNRKIYFGPLKLGMRPPLLILLQSVDGKMMLREVYQMEHNIPVDNKERTTAFWMIQINEQLHFEIEEGESFLQYENQLPPPITQQNDLGGEDSDDDCVIIDDHIPDQQTLGEEELGQLLPAATENFCSIITNPQSSGVPVLAKPLPQTISLDSPTELNKDPAARMNFTIQALDNNKQLQISQDPNIHPIQILNSSQIQDGQLMQLPMNTTHVGSGFVPLSVVITNVAPAPQEASYGSTIYISNSQQASVSGTNVIPKLPNSQLTAVPGPKTVPSAPIIKIPNTTLSNTLGTGIESELNSMNKLTKTIPKITTGTKSSVKSTVKGTVSFTAATTETNVATTIAPAIGTGSNSSTSQKVAPQEDILKTSPAKAGSMPIKRRRMSLRCPIVTDMETTNIAIDAAIKLLPDPYDVVSRGTQNSTVSAKRKIATSTAETINVSDAIPTEVSKTLSAPGSSMLVHNTTITKLKDSTSVDAPKKVNSVLLSNTDEALQQSSVKSVLQEGTSHEHGAKQTISEPIVFDVNFIDGTDEPAASIVIKPTSTSTLTSTTLAANTMSCSAQSTSAITMQNSLPKLSMISSVSSTNAPVFTTKTNVTAFPVKTILNPTKKYSSFIKTRPFSSTTVSSSSGTTTTIYSNANIKTAGSGQGTLQNVTTSNFKIVPTLLNTAQNQKLIAISSQVPQTITGSIPNVALNLQPKGASTLVPLSTTVSLPVRCTTKVVPAKQRTNVKQFNAQSNADRGSHVINLPQSKQVIKIQTSKDATDPLRTEKKLLVQSTEKKLLVQPQKTLQPGARISLPPSAFQKPTTSITSLAVKSVSNKNIVQQRHSLPAVSSKSTATDGITKLVPVVTTKVIPMVPQPITKPINVTSPTADSSQQDVQYGYFCTSSAGLPKFVAKRIGNEYLLRVPGLQGILKLSGLAHANNYINKYFLKTKQTEDIVKKLPALWRFIPQERSNQIQRKQVINKQLSSAGTTGNNALIKIPPKGSTTTTTIVVQKPKIVRNVGVAAEQNETILIED